ncbi:serpin-ZX-like isoform X2 [Lotus japonicus]|uniref:serpin-ZX-like isoform X2 n=1 Tax=Lotus japonicus TaxID=34305 RepID=UPI00258C5A02|nr:serpin-ZX-like isoform X2 [Lotus japonicus]
MIRFIGLETSPPNRQTYKNKNKKKRAHSLPSCSPSIIHRRTAACTLKHHFRGHRQTPHRCVIAEKHHKAPDFEHSSIGLIVRAKMDLQKSIRCQTEVALSITKHLFSKEEYQEKNLVFSPFSLHAILSVMAVGSAGSTLDELFSFLRFDSVDHLNTFFSQVLSTVLSDTTPSFLLSFVNEMWADKSLALSHSFKQLMTTHYKATLALVDFRTKGDQVCREVNSWVEKETNGLITELLPTNAVHKLTKLIFANALYFKGVWKHTFDPSMTFVDDFHLLNGTSIEVPFMSSEKKTQFIRTFDGFNVLRLSYKQGRDKKLRFSMCIFLPNAKDGLPSLIEKLASESCFLKGKLPRQKVRVRKFRIPKFKICFELEASNVLKELGVVSPFSKSNANFTKMVVSPLDELCVESIHHKASIERRFDRNNPLHWASAPS